jgi:hypothetical protein
MKTTVTRTIFVVFVLLAIILTPLASHSAPDPWAFLEGFQPLPSSLTRLTDRYVAVIYVKRDEQLVAAVFFNANCAISSCELLHRAGFAAVNAAGSDSRVFVEPDEKELLDVLAVIAAQYSLSA